MKRNIIILFVTLLFTCSFNAQGESGSLKLFFIELKTIGDVEYPKYYTYDLITKEKKHVNINQLPSLGPPIISENGKFFIYQYEEKDKRFIRLLDIENDKLLVNEQVPFSIIEKDFNKNYIVIGGNTGRYYYLLDILLVNIKTKEIKQITSNDVMDYNPVILPGNDAIFYLQIKDTETYLKKYSFEEEEIKTVFTFEDTGYYLFQWLNSNKLLLTKKDKRGTPFILDLETFEITDFNLNGISEIRISPDETKMAYLRKRDYLGLDLFVSDIDGNNLEKIPVDDNIDFVAPRWFVE